ncbi:MAG: hypothetical protein WCL51_17485 [Bacteroidota bacterium]
MDYTILEAHIVWKTASYIVYVAILSSPGRYKAYRMQWCASLSPIVYQKVAAQGDKLRHDIAKGIFPNLDSTLKYEG